MYAFFSALLAACVVLTLGLTETVTHWAMLVLIGLGSWLVLYFVLKMTVSRIKGKSVGEGFSEALGDIGGGFGDGASCGSGGCGSGGGSD